MTAGRQVRRAALAGALMIAGGAHAAADAPQERDWRRIATVADRQRLRNWRAAWIDALAVVRRGAQAGSLAAEPVLFDPDHAMIDAALPEGDYRCRTYKFGGKTQADRPLLVQPWVACLVSHDEVGRTFETEGAQHAGGHLFEGSDARWIFLGSLALGDERRVMHYGRDGSRDMAGVVERIAARRWRMVLPYPGFASTLDLIEIAAP